MPDFYQIRFPSTLPFPVKDVIRLQRSQRDILCPLRGSRQIQESKDTQELVGVMGLEVELL